VEKVLLTTNNTAMKNLFLTAAFAMIQFGLAAQLIQVSGKVTDAETGAPLPGARIHFESSTIGTSSSITGDFFISIASDKEETLIVSYIGYKEGKYPLKQSENGFQVKLSPEEGSLSEVVITGTLQGEAKALNQQRTADNIKNIVAADQIGRFPDPNAAEALQRIQGVNIERDQGEGRYVLIRGLAPQFTNISINGEQIPSPEAGVRFVALDAVPSDQLSSMEVSKTLTPDLDGDAIGGSVNLVTRTATSSTPTVRASLVGGYNNLMGEVNGQTSLQYGQRFFDSKLGIMINGSYYTNNLGSDNWERDTGGDLSDPSNDALELRDYQLTRTRAGVSGTIDYKFNSNHEVYVKAIYNEFTDREWRRRFVFVPEDEEVQKLVKDRFETQTISSYNAGGIHQFKKFRLDYEASIALAEQDTPYDNELAFIAGDMPHTLDFTADPLMPTINTTSDYLNNELYEFDEFETGNTLAQDQNVTYKFNVQVPYKTGASSGTLKFGAKWRFKDKDFKATINKYGSITDVPALDAFEGGLLDDNFLDGNYTLSTFQDIGTFGEYFNNNLQNFELNFEDKLVDEALESYVASEDVTAYYLMTTHRFKKLTAIGGVRYESTKVNYESQEVLFGLNGDLLRIDDISGSNNYDFVLPQLNLKYEVNNNTILRAAAVYSYARPNFQEIVPSQEVNINDREATIGNKNILPVSALNIDVFAERYLKNLGIISGGVYYKQLNDFIFNRRFIDTYPLNTPTPQVDAIAYVQAQNGGTANLFGAEIGAKYQLDFLPGKLKNLAVYFNYTYTQSDAQFNRSADERLESIQLPGQAAHVGNFSLGYNSKKLSLRAAVNFNGSYLSEIGATAQDDLYVNNRLQLDITAGYTVNKRLRFFVEMLNLTNQAFETYSGSTDAFVQREFYGWWSRAGIKFDLN
jgi:TonB-dependent receptor